MGLYREMMYGFCMYGFCIVFIFVEICCFIKRLLKKMWEKFIFYYSDSFEWVWFILGM